MPPWQAQIEQLRKDPRVPMAITVLLCLLLVISVFQLAFTLKGHHALISAAKAAQPTQPLYSLATLHMLGVYPASLAELPTTQLPFVLEGTIVVLDAPMQSHALISYSSQPTKLYQTGDTLPANVTITRIARHYVVIDDHGTLEKIPLPIQQLNATSALTQG